MPAIEQEFRTLLLADSTFATAIGSRLRPVFAEPAEPRPYVVQTVIQNLPLDTSNSGNGAVRRVALQFDCVGDTYASTRTVRDALLARLESIRALVGTNWTFSACQVTEAGRDDHDPPQNSDERGLHRCIVEAWVFARYSALGGP